MKPISTLVAYAPGYLLGSLLASLFAAMAYGLCRRLEKKWSGIIYIGWFIWILNGIATFRLIPFDWPKVSLWIAKTMFAAVSGYFHRRSGGISKNAFQATGLMALTALLTILLAGSSMIGVALISRHFSTLPTALLTGPQIPPALLDKMTRAADFFMDCLVPYPYLAPLAVWIWRSLRIRPGIDVPLQHPAE